MGSLHPEGVGTRGDGTKDSVGARDLARAMVERARGKGMARDTGARARAKDPGRWEFMDLKGINGAPEAMQV